MVVEKLFAIKKKKKNGTQTHSLKLIVQLLRHENRCGQRPNTFPSSLHRHIMVRRDLKNTTGLRKQKKAYKQQ